MFAKLDEWGIDPRDCGHDVLQVTARNLGIPGEFDTDSDSDSKRLGSNRFGSNGTDTHTHHHSSSQEKNLEWRSETVLAQ